MPKIGIFWVYRDKVIGIPRNLDEGDESCSGLLDSPDTHVDSWDALASAQTQYPELSGMDYEQVPRGRVTYNRVKKCAVIYFDKALNTPKLRECIATFFGLDQTKVKWEFDPHYATDRGEIDRAFE